jgi:hypothetical protein
MQKMLAGLWPKPCQNQLQRSRQKTNLVTFFAFFERCFENKLAGRTHSVYGQKDAKISYKSKKSPKPNLVTFFAFLKRCFENKLAGRTHTVYGQKDAKISFKSKKSPKPSLVKIFAFFLNPCHASDILRSKMSRSKLKTSHFVH